MVNFGDLDDFFLTIIYSQKCKNEEQKLQDIFALRWYIIHSFFIITEQ